MHAFEWTWKHCALPARWLKQKIAVKYRIEHMKRYRKVWWFLRIHTDRYVDYCIAQDRRISFQASSFVRKILLVALGQPRVPCGEVFAHECLSPCVDADESAWNLRVKQLNYAKRSQADWPAECIWMPWPSESMSRLRDLNNLGGGKEMETYFFKAGGSASCWEMARRARVE